MRDLSRFRRLDESQISQTLRRLRDRVAERFPGSGLNSVSAELVELSEESFECVRYLQRPSWPIRIAVGTVIAVMTVVIGLGALSIQVNRHVERISELVQMLESAINDIIFLGVGIYFLLTLEGRIKRRRALRSLHQLRSVERLFRQLH